MYYAPTLFALCGFTQPTAVGIVIGDATFVFTFIALKYIDNIGRRNLLIDTVWPMPVSLVVAAVAIQYIPISKDLALSLTVGLTWAGIIVLVFLIIYTISDAIALGTVSWILNEFFPMDVRSLGTMMVTCTCWGTNVVVSSTYLSMMKTFTPSGAFGFYAALCTIGWVLIILLFPEVKGLSLEESKQVFEHGFGAGYSLKLQKERQAQAEFKHAALDADTTDIVVGEKGN